MIELGLAWYDGSQFSDAETFEQAQQDAQKNKLGIWAQETLVLPEESQRVQDQDEKASSDQNGSLSNQRLENNFKKDNK
jgi:endonuclease YncB( thermonuclease family)